MISHNQNLKFIPWSISKIGASGRIDTLADFLAIIDGASKTMIVWLMSSYNQDHMLLIPQVMYSDGIDGDMIAKKLVKLWGIDEDEFYTHFMIG